MEPDAAAYAAGEAAPLPRSAEQRHRHQPPPDPGLAVQPQPPSFAAPTLALGVPPALPPGSYISPLALQQLLQQVLQLQQQVLQLQPQEVLQLLQLLQQLKLQPQSQGFALHPGSCMSPLALQQELLQLQPHQVLQLQQQVLQLQTQTQTQSQGFASWPSIAPVPQPGSSLAPLALLQPQSQGFASWPCLAGAYLDTPLTQQTLHPWQRPGPPHAAASPPEPATRGAGEMPVFLPFPRQPSSAFDSVPGGTIPAGDGNRPNSQFPAGAGAGCHTGAASHPPSGAAAAAAPREPPPPPPAAGAAGAGGGGATGEPAPPRDNDVLIGAKGEFAPFAPFAPLRVRCAFAELSLTRSTACWSLPASNHPGNTACSTWVGQSASQFAQANGFLKKARIVTDIIDKVQNQTPSGRFLKKDEVTGEWSDMMTSGAFRVVAALLYLRAGRSGAGPPAASEAAAAAADPIRDSGDQQNPAPARRKRRPTVAPASSAQTITPVLASAASPVGVGGGAPVRVGPANGEPYPVSTRALPPQPWTSQNEKDLLDLYDKYGGTYFPHAWRC
jgi:hypothetical protein